MPNGNSPAQTAAANTLSFYVPDLAQKIRAHVGDKRGAMVEWFRQIAKRDLIAAGAFEESEEASALREFREVMASKGAKAVRTKLGELISLVASEGGAR